MLSALFPPSPKVESLRGSKDAFSEMMSRARVLNAFNSHQDPPGEDEDKDDPELQLLYYSCGKPPPCAFETLCPGSEGGVGCQCYTCEQEALIHFSSHKQQCGACWGGAGCDGCEWCESVKSGHYARVDPLLRQMAQLPAEMVREIIGFAVGGYVALPAAECLFRAYPPLALAQALEGEREQGDGRAGAAAPGARLARGRRGREVEAELLGGVRAEERGSAPRLPR